MELDHHIKREEIGSDESESDWLGYAWKSGEIMFYYNIKTGEHRWPPNSSCSENTILGVRTSDVPRKARYELYSVAIQTEDYGCVNQCTSVYVDNGRQMENTENESHEIRGEVSDDDTVGGIEQNTLDDTAVDAEKDRKDFEMDESLSTIIIEMKREMELVQDVYPQQKNNANSYDCSYCSKKFKWKSRLELHVQTHEKPGKSNEKVKVPLRTDSGQKPFECSYCGKAFDGRSKLNAHLRIHTSEKPFECSYCNKAFDARSKLNAHLRIHTGEKPYECSYCDRAFNAKEKLNIHFRTHTGEKPFKCSYCDKAFNERAKLNIHLRTHTGEKPFKCSYCEEAFTEKRNLKRHLTKAHA